MLGEIKGDIYKNQVLNIRVNTSSGIKYLPKSKKVRATS